MDSGPTPQPGKEPASSGFGFATDVRGLFWASA